MYKYAGRAFVAAHDEKFGARVMTTTANMR